MSEKTTVTNDINLPRGMPELYGRLTSHLTFENSDQFGQGQFRIFHHQARFLLQTFFDPFSDHRLIMRLAFQLRYRFQDADQVFRQSNCFWRMAFGARHPFVKICRLHPMIFRLNSLLLCFGQFAESLLHRFLPVSLLLRVQSEIVLRLRSNGISDLKWRSLWSAAALTQLSQFCVFLDAKLGKLRQSRSTP